MVDIEPYKQIKKTNIQEHNDMVDKINEIVNVINNTDLENIGTKIDAIEATDTLQWKDIESIKAKDTEQDSTLATHTTEITELTKSLVSNIALLNGTTAGNMKVRIEREDAPFIDSNDYNIQKPTSVELIQGSAPAMVKAQITLSDGTVLVSDDFMFTTEAIGQDVYISSFVFKNGNVAGTISADIGLSNGSTLTANNFAVPTDPNVLSTIADLTSRTEALEQIDIGALKTTVDGHTISIEALDNEVTNIMLNKADVDNRNQNIKTGSIEGYSIKLTTLDSQAGNKESMDILANSLEGVFDEDNPFLVQGTVLDPRGTGQYVAKSLGKLALLNSDGTPKNFVTGGDVWEKVNQANWPTDWTPDDVIKVRFRGYCSATDTMTQQTEWGTFTECILNDPYAQIVYLFNTSTHSMRVLINNYQSFNKGNIGKFMTVLLSNPSNNFSYALTSAKNNSDYITIYRLKK